jgi:hypothetical protein
MFLKAFRNDITSKKIVETLEEIMANFPAPSILFTDNASIFRSLEIKIFCEEHGLKLRNSVKYTPETNGQIERSMQSTLHAIKTLVMEIGPTFIEKKVKLIQRAYNTTPHPTLNYVSPHYVVFGEECRYINNKFNIPECEEEKDRIDELKELEKIREKIPELLHKAFEKYEKYDNKNRKHDELKVNEKVLIKNFLKKGKMDPTYIGPFTIKTVLSPLTYIIDKNGRQEMVHRSRMKKYYEKAKGKLAD